MFQRLLVLIAAVVIVACAPNAPPPLAGHLYAVNDGAAGGIAKYALPLTSISTPVFTVASTDYDGLAFDGSGNLLAADHHGQLALYSAALDGGSTPTAAFRNGGATTNGQPAFTANGTLIVPTTGSVANVFPAPLSNASVPTSTAFNGGIASAIGAAVDSSGNLYLANGVAGASNIFVFAPPYTGTPSVITPTVSTATYRKMAINGSQLFVTSIAGATGGVDVYSLPLTSGSAPTYSLTSGMLTPQAIAFDAVGDLYVANANSTLNVYSHPVSSSSTVSTTVSVAGGSWSILGIAYGP